MSINREDETWVFVTPCGTDNITATAEGLDVGDLGTIPWNEIDEARAVATKKDRLDIFNEQYEAAVRSGAELAGLCTVRDAISFMFDKKCDINQLYYQRDGKEWTIELRIVGVNEIGNTIGETVTGNTSVATDGASYFAGNENSPPRICITCKHHERLEIAGDSCKAMIYPVYGDPASCDDVRRNGAIDCIPASGGEKKCGLDGNLWEPK